MPVLYDDGFESSYPVFTEIENVNQLGEVFNSITYNKASSLLIMLESISGETSFEDGLINYLNSNKFGSGNAADLFASIKLVTYFKL